MSENSLNNVAVVIAAYNEGAVVAGVVEDVLRHCPLVIVVSDGSQDETAEFAHNAGAVVVSHAINLGQGAALQTGIDYAVKAGAEVIVTFDADGQHQADEIEKVVGALREAKADIAFGSRFLGRAIGLDWKRKLVLQAGILFTAFTANVRLTDTHNGFRAMTRETAKRMRIRQNRMAHASEFIELTNELGLKYIEVPVTIVYTDHSIAKGQRLSNAMSIVLELVSGWLRSGKS